MEEEVNAEVKCPNCGSTKAYRNGHSHKDPEVQRWLCPNCGYRFSDTTRWKTQVLNIRGPEDRSNQLCAIIEEAKKLETTTENKTVVGDSTKSTDKILELAWWLKKNGRADSTIVPRVKLLKLMVKRGANLYDPESVKEVIAKQTWSNGRKNNAIDAYSSFLRMTGGKWEAPIYKKSVNYPSSQKKPKSTN